MTTENREGRGMNRDHIYHLIDAERARQQSKFGDASISGDRISDDKRVAIMAEELGEVAKASDRLTGVDYDPALSELRGDLRAELVQVAACAVGWLERLS